MYRQVFGLADMGLATRPTHLCFPVHADQCNRDFRFRLPLWGSSGFAPDSLLSQSDRGSERGTDDVSV